MERKKEYRTEKDRLKDTFDIDIQEGKFGEWKKKLSPAALMVLSQHDMDELEKAFLEAQLSVAHKVESTIAMKLYSADDLRMMHFQGVRYYPWVKRQGQ